MTAPPVFLTGFMATGKSRIGRLLAARLSRRFFDTDEMIEARAGKAVPAIFEEDGEEAFRRLESECVAAAAATDAVVALGGGAITRSANREAIRAAGGVLICLQADVETILQRVSRKEDRPLLAGLTPAQQRAKIEAMLAERAPYYAQADVTVSSCEDRSPEALTEELVEILRYWEEGRRP